MLLTTSRNASKKTRQTARELADSFPKTVYYSRGKQPLLNVIKKTLFFGKNTILVLCEKNLEPKKIKCIKIKNNDWSYAFEAGFELIKTRIPYRSAPRLFTMYGKTK